MPIFDAQSAMGFVESQTSYIEKQVNETVYPDIQYPSLVPVDFSAGQMAQTVTYYSSDKFGRAEWINGNSDDIPLAGTELTQFQTPVYTAAIGYGWGWEEVQQAQALGRNLKGDDAMAARRAYEEMVDRVALSGDTAKGFLGIINYSGINTANVTNGSWDDLVGTTADEILADINAAILASATATLYTSISDTLLLPFSKINTLATRRLGDTTMTVLEFVRMNNTYTAMTGKPLTIKGVRGLETAGAGSTNRMIAYRKDPQVLKMHIPMPHQFMPVYQKGPLRWEVPGVFRLGGLDIRRPAEVKYRDGI
jgi:hypothetical protein